MKFKHLSAIALLSIGLIACDNSPDYSGTYQFEYKKNIITYTFKKLSNNEYICEHKFGDTSSYKCHIKNEKFLFDEIGGVVGEFKNKDEFVDNQGDVYKKVK